MLEWPVTWPGDSSCLSHTSQPHQDICRVFSPLTNHHAASSASWPITHGHVWHILRGTYDIPEVHKACDLTVFLSLCGASSERKVLCAGSGEIWQNILPQNDPSFCSHYYIIPLG